MAVRGRTITLHCILLSYLPLTIFFIMVAYPGHILEITNGIMKGSTEDKNRIILSYLFACDKNPMFYVMLSQTHNVTVN